MGYESTAEGQIKIDPPLNHQELKGLPDLGGRFAAEIYLEIEEAEVETQHGTLISRTASLIRPVDGNASQKRYDTDGHLNKIIAAYPDHTFTGYFEFLGEDGDRWRTVVKDGEVIEYVKPELRWPE